MRDCRYFHFISRLQIPVWFKSSVFILKFGFWSTGAKQLTKDKIVLKTSKIPLYMTASKCVFRRLSFFELLKAFEDDGRIVKANYILQWIKHFMYNVFYPTLIAYIYIQMSSVNRRIFECRLTLECFQNLIQIHRSHN